MSVSIEDRFHFDLNGFLILLGGIIERACTMADMIPNLMAQVDGQRMRDNVFYLAKDPLPFPKLNYTRPGQSQCTLYEVDDFLQVQLESFGYAVKKEGVQVQAFRCEPNPRASVLPI